MAKDEQWEKIEGGKFWNPQEENDELSGEVIEITQGIYGSRWSIKTDNEEEILTPSHKLLQNRMSGIKVGETIRIVYKGTQPPAVRGQNPTKMYEVFRKK